jgi:hypothetical protein
MREYTHAFPESDEKIILEAITDTGKTFDRWITEKLETAIKAQKTANLAKSLRGFANALKLSLNSGAVNSVEQFIKIHHLEDRIQEFGGIGMFVKLANSCKGDYIPESKIRSTEPVYVSPAKLQTANSANPKAGE